MAKGRAAEKGTAALDRDRGDGDKGGDQSETRCGFFVRLFVYLHLVWKMEVYSPWHSAYQLEHRCKYPPLPTNHSGLKVMVAGFAKMGTRTLSRTLWELGLERSYHGEELAFHVWGPLAVDHVRKHHGRRNPPVALPWAPTELSLRILQATPDEELADRISRCRVDAVAFDGIEHLFFPVYAVSPGTKVLVLNWRTYEEATRSMNNFAALFVPLLVLMGHTYGGVNFLPYALIIKYIVEPLSGHPLKHLHETGLPLMNQEQTPLHCWYTRHTNTVHVVSHWFDGLGIWDFSMTRQKHSDWFKEVERVVPPGDLMYFDPRKTKYEDLCRFLGLKECRRKGKLPRAINLGNHELDFFPSWCLTAPIICVVHYINWCVFRLLLRLAWECKEAVRRHFTSGEK